MSDGSAIVGRVVANILSGSWRAAPPTAPSSARWPAGTIEALETTGGAALAWACTADPAQGAPGVAELLSRLHDEQIVRFMLQDAAIATASRALSDADVPHLIFKGRAAAAHYARPWLRPCGDIDLLISPDRLRDALSVFSALGADVPRASEVHEPITITPDWVYPPAVSRFDLHLGLSKFLIDDAEDILAGAGYIEVNGQSVPVLAIEDHLRTVCLHLLRHGGWRALWYCDVAAMIERLPESFDWRRCHRGDPMLMNWLGTCIGLARRLLGAETGVVPAALCFDPPIWVERVVLRSFSQPMQAYHARPMFRHALRQDPLSVLRAVRSRWPDPISSSYMLGQPYTDRQPLLAQLADFAKRSAQWLRQPRTGSYSGR